MEHIVFFNSSKISIWKVYIFFLSRVRPDSFAVHHYCQTNFSDLFRHMSYLFVLLDWYIVVSSQLFLNFFPTDLFVFISSLFFACRITSLNPMIDLSKVHLGRTSKMGLKNLRRKSNIVFFFLLKSHRT